MSNRKPQRYFYFYLCFQGIRSLVRKIKWGLRKSRVTPLLAVLLSRVLGMELFFQAPFCSYSFSQHYPPIFNYSCSYLFNYLFLFFASLSKTGNERSRRQSYSLYSHSCHRLQVAVSCSSEVVLVSAHVHRIQPLTY